MHVDLLCDFTKQAPKQTIISSQVRQYQFTHTTFFSLISIAKNNETLWDWVQKPLALLFCFWSRTCVFFMRVQAKTTLNSSVTLFPPIVGLGHMHLVHDVQVHHIHKVDINGMKPYSMSPFVLFFLQSIISTKLILHISFMHVLLVMH